MKLAAHALLSIAASFSLLNCTFASENPVGFTPALKLPAQRLNELGWWDGAQPPTLVTPLIWRSGRPTRDTLTALYASGVRAIIDLEDDLPAVDAEIIMAHEIGFKIFAFPTNSFWMPDDSKMSEIISYLAATQVPTLVREILESCGWLNRET